VIGLAKEKGYEVVERAIMPDELAKTDEVFITGTAVEVTPVAEIDQHKFQVGEITRSLVQAYDDLVNRRDGRTAFASIAAAE
jgi:branched-chain amino acid aminotransferase